MRMPILRISAFEPAHLLDVLTVHPEVRIGLVEVELRFPNRACSLGTLASCNRPRRSFTASHKASPSALPRVVCLERYNIWRPVRRHWNPIALGKKKSLGKNAATDF